jgi:hypothetical protein
MRRGMKRVLGLGVLAAAGYAAWRALEARKVDTGVTWQPRPFPYLPEPRETPPDRNGTDGAAWVEADDGSCPLSHPVKGKLTSGIFHEPGAANYERTNADRCYRSPVDAEADGLRASGV